MLLTLENVLSIDRRQKGGEEMEKMSEAGRGGGEEIGSSDIERERQARRRGSKYLPACHLETKVWCDKIHCMLSMLQPSLNQ